jgi:ABC-type spermidine/putrescine transport system permease subunit I
MATQAYRLLGTSAAVMIGALIATILVSGGWQAVAMAVALTAGLVVLLVAMVLAAMADALTPSS